METINQFLDYVETSPRQFAAAVLSVMLLVTWTMAFLNWPRLKSKELFSVSRGGVLHCLSFLNFYCIGLFCAFVCVWFINNGGEWFIHSSIFNLKGSFKPWFEVLLIAQEPQAALHQYYEAYFGLLWVVLLLAAIRRVRAVAVMGVVAGHISPNSTSRRKVEPSFLKRKWDEQIVTPVMNMLFRRHSASVQGHIPGFIDYTHGRIIAAEYFLEYDGDATRRVGHVVLFTWALLALDFCSDSWFVCVTILALIFLRVRARRLVAAAQAEESCTWIQTLIVLRPLLAWARWLVIPWTAAAFLTFYAVSFTPFAVAFLLGIAVWVGWNIAKSGMSTAERLGG